MPHEWQHMHDWMMQTGAWPMLLFWLLLIALIAAIFYLMQRGSLPRRSENDHDGAMRILDERYARGEIDRQEYLQRKGDIEAQGMTGHEREPQSDA